MLELIVGILMLISHFFIMKLYKDAINPNYPKIKWLGYIPVLNLGVLIVWVIIETIIQWYKDYKEIKKQ